MPRKGYRTITVTEDVYRQIQNTARETNRTIPEHLKYLIETRTTGNVEEEFHAN
jgi:hypothetical protein